MHSIGNYSKDKQIQKYYSVLCNCGHRMYISPKKQFKICKICGRKHFSPKEEFKNKLNILLGQVDRKA